MQNRFSFEGALSAPFKSAHFSSFPWLFAFTYAVLATLLVGLFLFLARGAIGEFIAAIEALEAANIDEDDPGAMMALVFGTMAPLLPFAVIGAVVGWVFYAVFLAASMRRYVRDERFYLRFGGDELRMMIVSLMWWLLSLVIFIIPIGMMVASASALLALGPDALSEAAIEAQLVSGMLGGAGMLLIFFPVYIFVATRLAPCFGLTVKDQRIRFFDAWNVSRGRFWPILGAFIIIYVVVSIISMVIDQILQFTLVTSLTPQFMNVSDPDDVLSILSSGSFLAMMGVYVFIASFVAAIQQHVIHAPAAFAARHDPRGSVDDVAQIDIFN